MSVLDNDPAFQSFLRTLNERRTMITADRDRQRASLLARRNIRFGELANQETRGLEGVDDTYEDRGMFRSGGRLESRADLIQQINEGRAQEEFNLAEGQSQANRTAASSLAGLAQQRAEQEISARARLSDREFAVASQARSERLAKEERERWEAEQRRLQSQYNSSGGSGGGYSPYTQPPVKRTPGPPILQDKSKRYTPGPRPDRRTPEATVGKRRYY